MKLSEMRDLLASEGIQLTKSLGQNFLHDGNQLRRIVKAAELSKKDKVLEIGPGLGPLTELLLENAGEVLAIEKDARLVEVLKKRFSLHEPRSMDTAAGGANSVASNPEGVPDISPGLRREEGRYPGKPASKKVSNPERVAEGSALQVREKNKLETGGTPVLRLLHDDALDFLKRERHDWSEWKLVANLPYSVASPILVELAQGERSPARLVATLQLEVAKRLMARAGDEDYGILTLLVQLDLEPLDWFKVPASCFFPQPEVDSACVVLERRAKPLLPENQRDSFRAIVKQAFSQRRKMMIKLLKQGWPEGRLIQAFEQMGLPAKARAESVSLPQFVALTSLLR